MAPRKSSSPLARVARQTAELSAAAPFVVAQRLGRMALAGSTPSAADRREFQTMFTEKAAAFQQSWLAMWQQAFASQWQLMQAWQAASLSMATGRRQQASRRAGHGLARATAQVLSAGMDPVHRKAVANAKRLSGRRARRA